MKERLYKYRFELFFISLIAIIFGSLLIPDTFFFGNIMPVLLFVNMIVGLIIFFHNKERSWITYALLILVLIVYLYRKLIMDDRSIDFLRFGLYFIFYVLVTLEIIKQVWRAKEVNKSVIFGLMSGYIALGFLAFFAFMTIEFAIPNSFNGLALDTTIAQKADDLMYYSYVTLMTIGYGDITPVTGVAQKSSMLFAMMGQFYLVIIMAVVIEKYIRHSNKG